MLKVKITETTGSRSNEDLSGWYRGKVTESAKFFVKRVRVDSLFTRLMDPGYFALRNSGMTVKETVCENSGMILKENVAK